jgi:hypothetical protein
VALIWRLAMLSKARCSRAAGGGGGARACPTRREARSRGQLTGPLAAIGGLQPCTQADQPGRR